MLILGVRTHTLVSIDFYNDMPDNVRPHLTETGHYLVQADGSHLDLAGSIAVQIEIGSKKIDTSVLIGNYLDGSAGILGMDVLSLIGCKLDLQNGTVIVGNKVLPTTSGAVWCAWYI